MLDSTGKPTSVLIVSANPKDTEDLSLEKEVRAIEESLRSGSESFSIKTVVSTTPRNLHHSVIEHRPEFFHFCGHGEGDAGLIFETKDERAKIVTTDAVTSLLGLFSQYIKCVFLNACLTRPQAEALSKKVQYVIGVDGRVNNSLAREFSIAFYKSISMGDSVEFAFKFAAAASLVEFTDLQRNLVPFLIMNGSYLRVPSFKSISALNRMERPEILKVIKKNLQPNWLWDQNHLANQIQDLDLKLLHGATTRAIPDQGPPLIALLFMEILSIIQPAVAWEIESNYGEFKFELVGASTPIESLGPSAETRIVVGAKCDLSASDTFTDIRRNFLESLETVRSWNGHAERAGDVVNSREASYILVALGSDISQELEEEAASRLEETFKIPMYILSITDLEHLIKSNIQKLKTIINRYSNDSEASDIIRHFSKLDRLSPPPRLRIKTRVPNRVRAGVPFAIVISIESIYLANNTISARLEVEEKSQPDTYFTLLSPSTLTEKAGISVGCRQSFREIIKIRLLCHHPNARVIGQIQFASDSEIVCNVDLSVKEVVNSYHPRFYWNPYEKYRRLFFDWCTEAQAGRGRLVACVGSGGAGKSRLCGEFSIIAEQVGIHSISLSHPNGRERPYEIIRGLFLGLCNDPFFNENYTPSQRVTRYLYQLNPALYMSTKESLSLIFGTAPSLTGSHTAFNQDSIVHAAIQLILATSRKSGCVIHLSDLHWCHPDILSMLKRVALETVRNTTDIPSVIFVFEGRIGHAFHRVQDNKADTWSTAAFEEFIDNGFDALMKVDAMTDKQSKGFLDHVLENTQSNHRRVALSMIPHQEKLVEGILQRASGNPHHMLEQLRLLRDKKVIAQNPRTGLLYMLHRSESHYEPPNDIVELIRTRFSYLKDSEPETANLIRAIALVEDRIPHDLFLILKAAFAPNSTMRQLEETDFIRISEEESGLIRFQHENYFHSVQRVNFSEGQKKIAVEVYQNYLGEIKTPTAETKFLQASVTMQATDPDNGAAQKLLEEAHDMAAAQYQDQLCMRITEMSIYICERHASNRELQDLITYTDKLRRMASYSASVGDRLGSCACLEKAIASLNRVVDDPAPLNSMRKMIPSTMENIHFKLIKAKVDLANVNINLLRTAYSSAILNEILPTVDFYIRNGSDEALARNWEHLRNTISNRIAVKLALDGELEKAIATAQESVSLARASDDAHGLATALLDLGNISTPKDAKESLKIVNEGLSILRELEHSPQEFWLGEIHRIMIELTIQAYRDENDAISEEDELERVDIYKRLMQELSNIYTIARSTGHAHEAGAAALLAGLCAILLRLDTVISWFMQSLDMSFIGNHLETLWRAHVNIAQFCIDARGGDSEGAVHHADHAYRLIEKSISNQPERALNKLSVPIAQIARIWLMTNDSRGPDMIRKYPLLKSFFPEWPSPYIVVAKKLVRSREFIQIGQSSFYLY